MSMFSSSAGVSSLSLYATIEQRLECGMYDYEYYTLKTDDGLIFSSFRAFNELFQQAYTHQVRFDTCFGLVFCGVVIIQLEEVFTLNKAWSQLRQVSVNT